MGDMIIERVPLVERIAGDAHLAGANNQLILLSRDQTALKSAGAGSIDLVVGRKSGRPDPKEDLASIRVSSRSDPDSVVSFPMGDASVDRSMLLGRADCVRLSARVDIKITSAKAYIVIGEKSVTIDGEINLGEGASERLLRGDTFARWAASHTHIDPQGGTTGPPVQPVPPDAFSKRPVRVV